MIQFNGKLLFFLVMFQVTSTFAVPNPIDILEMPSQNRAEVFQQVSSKLNWQDFLKIVNDDQQSMKIRWRAMMALTQLDKKNAENELPRFVQSKTWYIRNAAMIAMNEISKEKAALIAEKLLHDPALVVRSAAVDLLKNNLTQQRRDLLWDEFHQARNVHGKSNLWIRSQILEVLAKNPRPHERKLFETLISQKDAQIAEVAKNALEHRFK